MKKLLKSEICKFVNTIHGKSQTFRLKKKRIAETQNVCLGSANALPKHTLRLIQKKKKKIELDNSRVLMVIASSNCFPLTHLAAENYDREQLEQSLAITKATMP